jgi:hypothetical protein
LVADYANATADSKLNVMGIFTAITAPTFPTVHPQMYLVAQLAATSREYGRKFQLELKLINEDATAEVLSISQNLDVPSRPDGQKSAMNLIFSLTNLIFEKPGLYEFAVLVDGDEKNTLPIELIEARPTQ